MLDTPGHAREHLVFLDEETGALLCGDMVSTLSTIVIDPPEGDMAEYVRQLSRLAGPRAADALPGPRPARARTAPHGSARPSPTAQAREAMVLAALVEPGTLETITARAYADTPPCFHPVAARSCLASLLKLQGRGEGGGAGCSVVRA